MEDNKPRVGKRKRRRRKGRKSRLEKMKKEARRLAVIMACCFFLAMVLSFLTGKVPSYVDSVVDKQIQGAMGRQMKNMQMPGGGMPGGMDPNAMRRMMGR